MKSNNTLSKITQLHLSKAAYVYVRQSTPSQLINNQESTKRQYELAHHAVNLGWPKSEVYLIDEDLAKSGARADLRQGFQQLLAEISLGRVGIVISLEAARLARNCSDWYKLLELCSIFGTLIADCELVYDPRLYHDRLLLGLSGIMSEAELHHIRMRMYEGQRHKAQRGELKLSLPVGLERLRSGEVILHPDEEIQARIKLIFDKFRELASARAVVKYLRKNQLTIPTRPRLGPQPHDVVWLQASARAIYNVLKNPAYAGAYVYGKTKLEPTRRRQGVPNSGIISLPIEKWEVCIKDFYPAYISWQQYLSNQQALNANQYGYEQGKIGATRTGQLLLQGIALCGKCGLRMWVRYPGVKKGQYPYYICGQNARELGQANCQHFSAARIDAFIEQQILKALEPDKIEIALATFKEIEKEDKVIKQQWLLKIERAKYQATRAQRQYDSIEPENRLVARNLEKNWETKLRELQKIKQEYENWANQNLRTITEENQRQLLILGENLPKIWQASTTSNADRKRIVRLVIKEVIMDRSREKEKLWIQINWQTGAVTQHWLEFPAQQYNQILGADLLRQRISELKMEGKKDSEIAKILNSEGYRASKRAKITSWTVYNLRQKWNIQRNNQHQWEDGSYTLEGVAAIFKVNVKTLYNWIKKGMLDAHQDSKYSPWKISLSEQDIARLNAYLSNIKLPRSLKSTEQSFYKDCYKR